MKKRVLLVSEAHHLHSGFGTYSQELMTRLHKTNKYELAEFASYGNPTLLILLGCIILICQTMMIKRN